jgi:hypothetical protein
MVPSTITEGQRDGHYMLLLFADADSAPNYYNAGSPRQALRTNK